jgi:tight adherence protein B
MEPIFIALGVFLFVVFLISGIYYLVRIAPENEKRKKIKSRLMELSGASVTEATKEIDLIKSEQISAIPILDKTLTKFSQTGQLQKLIQQADIKLNAGTFILLTMVALALGYFLCSLFVKFIALEVLAGIGCASIPLLVIIFLRNRRFHKFESLFPEALDLLTRAIKAGHAFNTGVEMIAQEMPNPIGKEFRIMFDEQNYGLPLKQALFNMLERMPLLDLKFFVTAILMQKETGGNLAEILTNLSHLIRERFKIQGEIRTYSAQGRLTGYILTAVPLGMLLVISLLNWNYIKPLFFTEAGHYLLAAGALGQIVGYICIRKIVNIKI